VQNLSELDRNIAKSSPKNKAPAPASEAGEGTFWDAHYELRDVLEGCHAEQILALPPLEIEDTLGWIIEQGPKLIRGVNKPMFVSKESSTGKWRIWLTTEMAEDFKGAPSQKGKHQRRCGGLAPRFDTWEKAAEALFMWNNCAVPRHVLQDRWLLANA